MSAGVFTCPATTYGFMKMPEPTMPPMTSIVASNRPISRASDVEAGGVPIGRRTLQRRGQVLNGVQILDRGTARAVAVRCAGRRPEGAEDVDAPGVPGSRRWGAARRGLP